MTGVQTCALPISGDVIISGQELLKVYAAAVDEALAKIAERDARIAALEALIIDVHEDLCCQTNYDDKIGFDKLYAEVTKIKSRVAMDGKDD